MNVFEYRTFRSRGIRKGSENAAQVRSWDNENRENIGPRTKRCGRREMKEKSSYKKMDTIKIPDSLAVLQTKQVCLRSQNALANTHIFVDGKVFLVYIFL